MPESPSGRPDGQQPKPAKEKRRKPSEGYARGPGITRRDLKSVSDLKLKGKLRSSEKKVRAAVEAAERTEVLLTTDPGYLEADGPLERTYHFRQDQIASAVDEQSARKAFHLTLDQLGPYRHAYSRDGQHLLLGGRKGHLALMEWQSSKVLAEVQVRETVRDVCFLHQHAMFAVAQKKDLFIYDSSGIELHCLRSHRPCVHRLGFLPFHFLLATVGETGHLRYLDVSTGTQVAEHATKLGACSVLALNPANAVCHLGHGSGVVTLWSPNLPTPHVRMFCHTAPLSGCAVDLSGRYMATAALDGRIKVWDLRVYKELHTYHSARPAHSLALSASGILAVGHGPHVEMWRDALAIKQPAPYMSHLLPASAVCTVGFCAHEDVLGVGHAKGFASLLVPGAGEAAFDAFEANPYATKKQRCARGRRAGRRAQRRPAHPCASASARGLLPTCEVARPASHPPPQTRRREAEVTGLLEKLAPDTIALDASVIGTIERAPDERQAEARAAKATAEAERLANRRERKKARGRSKSAKKLARKSANVNDEQREKTRAAMAKRAQERERAKRGEQAVDALDRFAAPVG